MFKRQFYAIDHADHGGDEPSSSDSSVNSGSDDDSGHEEEEDDASSPSHGDAAPGSDDSDDEDGGGEPGDSESDEEWDAYRDRNVKVVQSIDSSHFLSKKPAEALTDGAKKIAKKGEKKDLKKSAKKDVEDSEEEDSEEEEEVEEVLVGDGVVLRVGGILKCRYCVKTICLSDETMRAHLLSKGHARSLKLLAAGKLKVQLNSDGEEEEEGETHAERLARVRSVAEEKVVPVKRKADSGRQRQRKRAKQRAGKAERAKLKQK
ncbi:hypothetical protein KC19_2G267700 [Ceratodon purpureus]|uniref:Uncharacterized protein n=1 Tax=Ceratodon purpureus TaxID=3225 RepID=A0A8T0J1L1_CERPU|nr:hypothetical protein KC19_2G267700 [Ceratodon purpureus]